MIRNSLINLITDVTHQIESLAKRNIFAIEKKLHHANYLYTFDNKGYKIKHLLHKISRLESFDFREVLQ